MTLYSLLMSHTGGRPDHIYQAPKDVLSTMLQFVAAMGKHRGSDEKEGLWLVLQVTHPFVRYVIN